MRFDVRAIKSPGGVTLLAIDAPDSGAARAEALRQGYAVLSLRARRVRLRRSASFPLLLFAQELHALLDAGLALVEALESLAEKDRGGATGAVLAEVIRRLREGQSFSQALDASPAAFPPFFVATVRASERSGHLPQALGRFANYQ